MPSRRVSVPQCLQSPTFSMRRQPFAFITRPRGASQIGGLPSFSSSGYYDDFELRPGRGLSEALRHAGRLAGVLAVDDQRGFSVEQAQQTVGVLARGVAGQVY